MYKILSRALEARSSCHCAICSSARPGIARKVNTSTVRRRIQLGDVATIVYGTVLGTAAFYNGTSKKRKREALDNSIAGIVSENQALMADQEARLRALGYNGTETEPFRDNSIVKRQDPEYLWTSLLQTKTRPVVSQSLSASTRSFSSHVGQSHAPAESMAYKEEVYEEHSIASPSGVEALPNLRPQMRAFESIFPEERPLGKTIEEAWNDITLVPNPEKTRIREVATLVLVLRLSRMYLEGVTDKGASCLQFIGADGNLVELHLKDFDGLDEKIKELRAVINNMKAAVLDGDDSQFIGSLPCPRYYDHNRDAGEFSEYHGELKAQQQAFADLLYQADGPQDTISKVCTFLMSQTSAPNIHIINLLLIRFLDLRWFSAAEVVATAASSFLANHNEVTDVAIMEYLHLSGKGDFDQHRMCMLGADGRTTRSAFVSGKLVPDTWASEQLVEQTRQRDGQLMLTHGLKAAWTAQAFTIVVLDLLSRGKLISAFSEITTMRISGLQETPEILDAFLQYSVFKQDWDIAVKTWVRYETLAYERSPLTWYWMLQACAVCKQPDAFEKVVAAGQEECLSKDVTYEMGNFVLSSTELKDLRNRVNLLRSLQHKIHVPGMPHRDLQVPHEDIIQLPSLKHTLLMSCLQYANLRTATCAWSQHASRPRTLEDGLKDMMQQFPGDTTRLKAFLKIWTGYGVKLEAIAAVCSVSYMKESPPEVVKMIERLALTSAAETESDADITILQATFNKRPPATKKFYDLVSRQFSMVQTATPGIREITDEKSSQFDSDSIPPNSNIRIGLSPVARLPYISKSERTRRDDRMQKQDWVRFHSLAESNASRMMIRAASRYASSRYWNRVLHPKSPANLISTASDNREQTVAASLVNPSPKILNTDSTEQAVLPQQETANDMLIQRVTALNIKSEITSPRFSKQHDDTTKSIQPNLTKKKPFVNSSWIRLETRNSATESSLQESKQDANVHSSTSGSQLHSHVPWQSLKPAQLPREKNERLTNDDASDDVSSGLFLEHLPGLVGLNERFRYT